MGSSGNLMFDQGEGSKPLGRLNQRVLAALQGIRDVRRIQDWPRVKFLQSELQDLASRFSIPLYVLGHISIPDLSPVQNAAIHCVVRTLVKSCDPRLGKASSPQGGVRGPIQTDDNQRSV